MTLFRPNLGFAGVALVVLVATLSQPACSVPNVDEHPQTVIIISLDTTRADRLGCYGWRQGTTPNIDRLARDGIVFENAHTTAPLTLPAHSSLMTGLELHEHGVLNNGYFKLRPEELTLAEILSTNGWTTGAVVSAIVLQSKFGIDQGFESFDDHIGDGRNTMGITERQADESVGLAIEWIEANQDVRSLFWLHLFDPHFTYEPPEPFRGRFPGVGYEDEIAFVDDQVGRLIERLKDDGLYESTMLIVVGDHGEAFQEHREQTHGYFVYEPTMRIPLIIKPAGTGRGRGLRITDRVGIIDIFPTVLDVLDIKNDRPVTGISLQPMWNGTASGEDRLLVAQSIVPSFYGANVLHSAYNGRWKLIRDSRPELFDLEADPGEEHNVSEVHPEIARELSDRLAARLEKRTAGEQVSVDSEDRAGLRALGYVAGPGGNETEDDVFDPGLPSVHDFHSVYKASSNVQVKMLQGKLDEAAELCETVLEVVPDHIDSLLNLAEIRYRQGDLKSPEHLFEKVIAIDPNIFHAWNNLGITLAHQGRLEEATDAFLSAGKVDSSFASVPANLAAIYRQQGKTEDAERSFLVALEKDPEHFEALQNLGQLAVESGRIDEGRGFFERALVVKPGDVGVSIELANILADHKEWASAARVLLKASEIEPDNVQVLAAAALALGQTGEFEDSLDMYHRCLTVVPFDPVVLHQAAVIADQIGESEEAISLWERSLEVRPDNAQALNGLAWRLLMEHQDDEKELNRALGFARNACELTAWSEASLIDTLAAVLDASGRHEAAASRAQQAFDLARSQGQDDLAREIESRLAVYRQKLNLER